MGMKNPPQNGREHSVGAKRPTTNDLFLRLAKTERARSAKADNVFRKLRQSMNFSDHDDITPQTTRPLTRDASLELKIAARDA